MRFRFSPILILALITTVSACGQYVAYDDNGQPPVGGPLDDFPEVSQLKHYVLASIMRQYTSTNNDGFVLLDYDGLAADEEGSYLLDQYLASVSSVDPEKLSQNEKLPYWINTYNALVVRGVLKNYAGNVGYTVVDSGSFFDDPVITVSGITFSLNQLEHGVIRGKSDQAGVASATDTVKTQLLKWHQSLWQGAKVDARFHATVNCAALSCPNLLAEEPFVFRSDLIESQLQKAVTQWLDHEQKGANASGISKLFDWYGEDFVAHSGSIDGFVEAYRTGGKTGVNTSAFLDYDWTLNRLAK